MARSAGHRATKHLARRNPCRSSFLFVKRPFAIFLLILLLLLATGCGEVITKPAATVVIPTSTPEPTRAMSTPTATSTPTPVPATPEPTETPTPEPTPITHILQAGDTLIGLARKYGVTVQAIQEANGITDPRGLLVGQQIIIPTDPEARLNAGTPTPEPTPAPMIISPLTFWEQPDALWVLGQVTLEGAEAVEDVVIQIDLLDADGQIVASAQTPVQQSMLLPAESAGFGLQFRPHPAPFVSYHSRIISAQPAHVPFYHRDLAIENVLAQDIGKSGASLSGEVINRGADTATAVHVSVILYDDAGRVTAVRRVMADPPELQPGETGFFSAELLPVHLPVADYHLLAEGQREMSPHE